MYSVSMGREEDSRITADEAVRTMDQILGLTQIFNGGKPIFVDQFLFMDNTPGFEKNGRLIESEIPAFIVNSSDVLRRRSKGYGIWTYRDYCDSVVYNAQFGLDEKGWNFQGEAYVMDDGGNKRAYLPSRSAIVQDFNVQLKKGSQVHVQFSAAGDEGSHMTVNMGTESQDGGPVGGEEGLQHGVPGQAVRVCHLPEPGKCLGGRREGLHVCDPVGGLSLQRLAGDGAGCSQGAEPSA